MPEDNQRPTPKEAQTRRARRVPPRNEKHVIVFLFVIAIVLTTFLGTLLLIQQYLAIPDLRSVANYTPPQATVIYDRLGNEIDRIYIENRTVVGFGEMHPLLPKAFVAAEDGRFFTHPGLDFLSVVRAMAANMKSGRKSQGGSTITQQVARALLLSPEKTYIRKFKEAILAWRIDSLLSKEDILFIYLNQIYLGEGAHGVEAAARTYFSKSARQLNLAEVAMLAGLPQAPSRYSPLKHFELARGRQRYVLNRMVEDGIISADVARSAYEQPITLHQPDPAQAAMNGYYIDTVKKQVAELVASPLSRAGVKVYTYLDQHLQHTAQQALQDGLKATASRLVVAGGDAASMSPQGALVCMERASGKIRALVGGRDYRESPFNRAVQAKRPAGSTFKPFVYGAALGSGWRADSLISDAPLAIPQAKGQMWRPRNYSGQYHGDVTLESSLANSYNIATVRLMQKVGIDRVQQLARRAGITADMPHDLSLALGSVDVSLLEMTAAYTPFVNSGTYVSPVFLEAITVDGIRINPPSARRHQAMESTVAGEVGRMLEKVIISGTGQRAGGLVGRSGGKTGTSDKSRDAWFIGFHGDYLAGVWVGHDRNQSLGEMESGGRTAAPIWREFMGRAAVAPK